MPVAVATAEIGHPHQLRNHAHHLAATAAAEHAHDVAAAGAVTFRSIGRTTPEAAGDSAKATAAVHHPAHHRPHGLHHHAEAALAHLRLHHFEHRRHLGHHVAAATSAAKAGELGLRRRRCERNQQQQRCCPAYHLVSSRHGSVLACVAPRQRCKPDA